MSVAIGIDLGTTNTVVAAVIDGVAVTLEDEQGRRLLPSVVSFHPSSTVLVGEPARERRLIDPENTIYSVKPLLGRPWDSDEVRSAVQRFPFQLVQGAKNCTMVLSRDVAYALPEISAFVLRRAKAIAEASLGEPVDRAVITVPANFNDLQRASTKIAGKLAGLEVMRILNEPTAAALAYGQSISRAEKIAVYDLGGGTFDITLLDLTGNVFEVLATAGDTALGGDDVDRLLAERIAVEVLRRFNVDPRTNAASAARLTFVAEELKKELSKAATAQREISGIGYAQGGHPIRMPFTLTREELESIARPLVERTIGVARRTMEGIRLTSEDFDRVILVGGSTRMPFVAKVVQDLFGQPPHLKVNPDEVVALGAAIQAHALNRTKSAHKRRSGHGELAKAEPRSSGQRVPTRPPHADPTPENPRIPPMPRAPAMQAEPPIPEYISFTKAPKVISFSELPPSMPRPQEPPQRGKPPPLPPKRAREASGVSGSAIVAAPDLEPLRAPITQDRFDRGSAIETSASAPLLIDVTPLSLGLETAGGYADVLIPANSPVPCEKTRTFLTASDSQTMVSIRVAQGESTRFVENTRLGDLVLTGLRRARRGEVKVSVTFELDADGILNVRALDQDTGRETMATMRLLGANTDAEDVGAMAERQARHVVA
jgi:molecular chaperone DnaK